MILYPRPAPFLGEVLAHSLSTSGTGHMGPILGPRSPTGDLVVAQRVVAPVSTYNTHFGYCSVLWTSQMWNIWSILPDLLQSVPTRLVQSVGLYHLVGPGSAPMRLFPGRPPRGCTLHTTLVPK